MRQTTDYVCVYEDEMSGVVAFMAWSQFAPAFKVVINGMPKIRGIYFHPVPIVQLYFEIIYLSPKSESDYTSRSSSTNPKLVHKNTSIFEIFCTPRILPLDPVTPLEYQFFCCPRKSMY